MVDLSSSYLLCLCEFNLEISSSRLSLLLSMNFSCLLSTLFCFFENWFFITCLISNYYQTKQDIIINMAKSMYVLFCRQASFEPKVFSSKDEAIQLMNYSPKKTLDFLHFDSILYANNFKKKQDTLFRLNQGLTQTILRKEQPTQQHDEASKIDEVVRRFKATTPLLSIDSESQYSGFFDGCSKGNSRQSKEANSSSFGYLIEKDNECVLEGAIRKDSLTNNEAEYSGLISLMIDAYLNKILRLNIYGDSELVIRQMKGQYQVKSQNLKPYYHFAKKIEQRFQLIRYEHIARDLNSKADALANSVFK